MPLGRSGPDLYRAAVRNALSFDDVEAIERQRTPEAHRSAAAELLAWAEQGHPDDEVTPADLLSAAAWHLGEAGDTEESLDLHRRAVAIGRTTSIDARCLLHGALLDVSGIALLCAHRYSVADAGSRRRTGLLLSGRRAPGRPSRASAVPA